jgi:hypothetical protein
MAEAGFGDDEVDAVVWRNPVGFFSQSGRLELDEVEPDPTASFEGNVITRGEARRSSGPKRSSCPDVRSPRPGPPPRPTSAKRSKRWPRTGRPSTNGSSRASSASAGSC